MSREIKFRAWDKKEKGWCVAFVISNNGEAYSSFGKIDSITDNIKYWKENVVIMQFTGLKDKNGKEIYEGDIVRNDNDQKPNQEIIFAKGMFCLDDENSPLWKYAPQDFWEVIGNIYETPHLLTKE